MSSGNPERIVCACSRVSAREIETAIAGGAASLEALARDVDAGTGCRTCHPELRTMLAAAALRRLRGRAAATSASPSTVSSTGAERRNAAPDGDPEGELEGEASTGDDAGDAGLAGFRLEPVPLRLGTRRRG